MSNETSISHLRLLTGTNLYSYKHYLGFRFIHDQRFFRTADSLGQHFVVIWRGLPMHVQIPASDERLSTAARRVPKWAVVITLVLVHTGGEYQPVTRLTFHPVLARRFY